MLTRPITRGITRPITRPLVRQSSTFNPLTLFAQGQQGAWYDPSDLATLFQDAAGTIPVTADGDPVGLMLDKSGNDNHAVQSTTAAKPVYRTDGTLHWLEFDGTDDELATQYMLPLTDSAQSYLYSGAGILRGALYGPAFAEEQISAGYRNVLHFMDSRSSSSRLFLNVTDSSNFVAVDRLSPLSYGEVSVDSVKSIAGDYEAFHNAVSQGTASDSRAFSDQSTRFVIGRQYTNQYNLFDFFGATFSSGEHTAQQRVSLEKYLAAKAGVTLP